MSFLYFIKIEKMKKPKSRVKRQAEAKRGLKRNKRLRESRIKVAKAREAVINKRRAEKKKYEEFMKKMMEARLKGEF